MFINADHTTCLPQQAEANPQSSNLISRNRCGQAKLHVAVNRNGVVAGAVR